MLPKGLRGPTDGGAETLPLLIRQGKPPLSLLAASNRLGGKYEARDVATFGAEDVDPAVRTQHHEGTLVLVP